MAWFCIVNIPVLFDFFTHELRLKGKNDFSLRAEHEPDNISDCKAFQFEVFSDDIPSRSSV